MKYIAASTRLETTHRRFGSTIGRERLCGTPSDSFGNKDDYAKEIHLLVSSSKRQVSLRPLFSLT